MDRKTPAKGGAYVVDPDTNQLRPAADAVPPPAAAPADNPVQKIDMAAPEPEPVAAGLMDEEEVY